MSTTEADLKAKAEADAKAKAAAAKDDGLVEVKKDGKKLRVHPATLKDHNDNGWK